MGQLRREEGEEWSHSIRIRQEAWAAQPTHSPQSHPGGWSPGQVPSPPRCDAQRKPWAGGLRGELWCPRCPSVLCLGGSEGLQHPSVRLSQAPLQRGRHPRPRAQPYSSTSGEDRRWGFCPPSCTSSGLLPGAPASRVANPDYLPFLKCSLSLSIHRALPEPSRGTAQLVQTLCTHIRYQIVNMKFKISSSLKSGTKNF